VHGTQCRGKWVQKKIGEKKPSDYMVRNSVEKEDGIDLIWSPYGQKNVRWEDSGLAAENTEDFCGPTKKKSADQKKRRLDGCIGIEARTREEEKKNAGTDVRQRSAS